MPLRTQVTLLLDVDPDAYPSTCPGIRLEGALGMSDARVGALLTRLGEEAEALAGELMLGALFHTAQDLVHEFNEAGPEGGAGSGLVAALCLGSAASGVRLAPMHPVWHAMPNTAARLQWWGRCNVLGQRRLCARHVRPAWVAGSCAVCLEPLTRPPDAANSSSSSPLLAKLPCFHCYHQPCFVGWWSWQQHELVQQERALEQRAGTAAAALLKVRPPACCACGCCRRGLAAAAVVDRGGRARPLALPAPRGALLLRMPPGPRRPGP